MWQVFPAADYYENSASMMDIRVNSLATQSIVGIPSCLPSFIDAAVGDAFLTALAPAELDALSRSRRVQQQTNNALRSSAERELERKRYTAALAERQFNRADPDNRLVASELERRWEAALNDVRAAEEALARQTPPKAITQVAISKELNDKVISLTGRLPQIWGDETISDAHRKALLRCLIEKVVLDRGERDLALARIVWRGGAVTELEVKMSVNSVTRLTRGTEMRERLLTLARDGVPDDKIATILTREGHRSPRCADKVLPITVGRLRRAAAIKVTAQRSRWEHDDSYLSPPELARRLEIPVNWLYVQIRTKRLLIDRQPSGAYLFPNTPSVLHAIGDLRNHVIAQLDLRICQPNKEGHQPSNCTRVRCMTPSLICGHSKRPSRPRRL
ncbi:hypothetical protein ABIE79_006133 [Bradyrhizobium diazoefficiens]